MKDKVVVTFTREEILSLRRIMMDSDGDGALGFIKDVIKKINESENKALKGDI